MWAKQKIRLCVDFVMVILMPCLMAYAFMGGKLHEWLGLAMFLLFFLHHLLNAGWHRALGKGSYTANRILGIVTNLLLLLAMVFLAVSSVILSGYVPWNIKGSMAVARLMHLALSYWVFVLASFHLGIYWNRIPVARKVMADKKISALLRLVLLLYAAYGVHVFIKRQFALYMFLQVQFAFLDYGEPVVLFFMEYFAVMCLSAVIGYYMSALLYRLNRSRGHHDKNGG